MNKKNTIIRWLKRNWLGYNIIIFAIIALFLTPWNIVFRGISHQLPGFQDKTIWDLIELVFVPLLLLLGGYLFSLAEHKVKNKIADESLQETSFQIYLDRMTDLLIDRNINNSKIKSEQYGIRVRAIARARTLTILRQLNSDRKGLLVRFLYQSKLIAKNQPVIDLSGADLSDANLSGSDLGKNRDRTFLSYLSLSEAQLGGANLTGADLSEAKLSETNLMMADLTKANLSNANLMFADLRCATLTGANLHNTNLGGADLSGASGLTQKQLRQANNINGATLTDSTNKG